MSLDSRLKRLEAALSGVPSAIHLVVVWPGQTEDDAVRDACAVEVACLLLIVGVTAPVQAV